MSPENQGVFSAFERCDFSKNSGIFQLTKMGLFWGDQSRLIRAGWLVVQKFNTACSFRNQQG